MSRETRPYPPREPPVSLVCCHCGAEFSRPAWKVRQAAKQTAKPYCGYSCSRAARRVHTPESKAEYHKSYREKNREIINEKQNAARAGQQRDYILARDREIYRRNIDINRQRAREYATEHREQAKARRKAWPEKNPERNSFHIVRNNIAQGIGLRPRDIPDELVEAKVEQLRIMRWVREQIAQADRNPKGEKPQALSAKHESPVGETAAPKGE